MCNVMPKHRKSNGVCKYAYSSSSNSELLCLSRLNPGTIIISVFDSGGTLRPGKCDEELCPHKLPETERIDEI